MLEQPCNAVFECRPGEQRSNPIGSRIATAEGRIVDAAGKLYAHSTTTCIVLNGS